MGNILIVEDDPNVRKLVRVNLAKRGYSVSEAENSQQALALFQSVPVDLVLLDLNLPVMDGREVLKEIREDQDITDIPVVVLTTSQNEEDILKMYKLHANCYITKPVDFKQFTQIIKQIEGFWLQLVKLPSKRDYR